MIRALLLVAALALPVAAHAADQSKLKVGENLAQTNCGACHATQVKGASPRAEAPPFRILYKRYPAEALEEALAEGISVGHPDMPHILWEARDIEAFTIYLKSLQPIRPRVRR